MSSQSSGQPSDWRRRSTAATGQDDSQGQADPASEQADAAASRTLFSFLEPVLDLVAAYGAPMVLAGIVALVAGIALVAFVPSMALYGFINIGIGVFLIGLIALISLSSVVAAFFSRTGRYGVNSTVMLLAFTGIIVVISIISFENSKRIDMTATNHFSLAQRTQDSLKQLENEVQVTAFFKDNPRDFNALVQKVRVEQALREFKAARSSKFFYQFKDPDLEPDLIRRFVGETFVPFENQTIVLEDLNSGRTHIIVPAAWSNNRLEQQLATGLMVIAGQERRTIYFLSGHGERGIDSNANDGYAGVKEGLQGDNYDVRTLRWDEDDTDVSVPDGVCESEVIPCLPEAAMLVIARPTAEFPDRHSLALDLYLRGLKVDPDDPSQLIPRREGGRLIFLAEPDTPQSYKQFLARWGIVIVDGYIRDEERSPEGQPRTLQVRLADLRNAPQEYVDRLVQDTQSQDPVRAQRARDDLETLRALEGITSPKGRLLPDTYMPGAAALAPLDDGQRLVMPLASTSRQSYLINDIERTEPIKDKGDESDPVGPFFPVIYMQSSGPLGQNTLNPQTPDNQRSTILVFGDSDFISNGSLASPRGSGVDFFLNSANYLLGDFTLLSIRPKAFNYREFNLDSNEYDFVRFSTWLFLPGILALMAGLVWWVRR